MHPVRFQLAASRSVRDTGTRRSVHGSELEANGMHLTQAPIQQHRIAKAQEAVVLAKGFVVKRAPARADEGIDHHQQRGSGHVEVGHQHVDHLPLVRALESAATFGSQEGRTELFIHRPYEWRAVDVMMTNFHMPRTTLLMMIDAFVGDRWRRLYGTALAEHYRFLSFGDAMLLDRSLT